LRRVGPGIGVVQGNRGLVGDGEWALEFGAEVGILFAAVAGVPAKVDVEVEEVGQATDLFRSGCLAAGERSEGVELNGLRAFQLQVGVEEGGVA
jgi:hypothetical protein